MGWEEIGITDPQLDKIKMITWIGTTNYNYAPLKNTATMKAFCQKYNCPFHVHIFNQYELKDVEVGRWFAKNFDQIVVSYIKLVDNVNKDDVLLAFLNFAVKEFV